MNLSEIVALLCNEPFRLRIDEAKRLTLFQVYKLYLRERDKNGVIQFESKFERPDKVADWVLCNRVPEWRVKECASGPRRRNP